LDTDAVGVSTVAVDSKTRLGVYTPTETPGANKLVLATVDGVIDPLWWVVGVNSETINTYTLVRDDHNQHKVFDQDCVITVPSDLVDLPIGTEITFRQASAGQVSFVADSGVTIQSKGDFLVISEQNGRAHLIKEGANEWFLSGDIGPATVIAATPPVGGEEGDFWIENTP
jgi:hypothetical protein